MHSSIFINKLILTSHDIVNYCISSSIEKFLVAISTNKIMPLKWAGPIY